MEFGPTSRAELDTIRSGLREVAERAGIPQSAINAVLMWWTAPAPGDESP
jgi:hypothetical protein